VLAVMVTPGAAAAAVTSNPLKASLLSIFFAETALLGGIVLSLGPGLPISGYVATIMFGWYLVCRLIGWRRRDVRQPVPAVDDADLVLAGAPLSEGWAATPSR